ncbi:MAG: Pseudouridylate synthase [Chitinophagaceae bacterium]|nr:Pseudouridylate synthase [Chitinophagaceae bacterium]
MHSVSASSNDSLFHSFPSAISNLALPERFTLLLNETPHALCLLAAEELQGYLREQKNWSHNFGLTQDTENEGAIIGKMFGVLVVQTKENEVGYLAAFSGKLAGGNHHAKFVPPVFDSLTENSFLNEGMTELSRINRKIEELEELKPLAYEEKIINLKSLRKIHSMALQQKLFDSYYFLNRAGEEKSLNEIFAAASYKNPPSGAGECAGPKLLQYAFKEKMRPIALAEFWWGQSPKSDFWKHGHFYPCCQEKCEPILAHMLVGIDQE